MAFVRKYKDAGTIEQKKKFKWDGVGEFDVDELDKRMSSGFDQFLGSSRHDDKMKGLIRDEFNKIRTGLLNGTLTRNADGTYTDTAGGFTSNDGRVHQKKIFDKINVGGVSSKDPAKDTRGRQNASGYALGYLNSILKGMNSDATKAAEETPKTKFNGDAFVKEQLGLTHFGNKNGFNNTEWHSGRYGTDEQGKLANIYTALLGKNTDDLYDKYDWSDTPYDTKDAWNTAYSRLMQSLGDNKYDDEDMRIANSLGFNLSPYITSPNSAQTEEKVEPKPVGNYFYTVDDKGNYSYTDKDGNAIQTNNGLAILPGNVLDGLGNNYLYEGNLYDDSNIPEQFRESLAALRRGDTSYTALRSNNVNPTESYYYGQGYRYGRQINPAVSGLQEGETLLQFVKDPADINSGYQFAIARQGKFGTTPVTITKNGIEGYDIAGKDYNRHVSYTGGGVQGLSNYFVDFTDKSNLDNLFNNWYSAQESLKDPASATYKIVTGVLNKWLPKEDQKGGENDNPWGKYGNQYTWAQGGHQVRVIYDPNTQQYKFTFDPNESADDQTTVREERVGAPLGTSINKSIFNPLVTARRKGGKLAKIFKYQTGTTKGGIRNVYGTTHDSWHDLMYMSDDMQNWLGTFSPENYKKFNELQDSWYENRKNTGYTLPYNKTAGGFNQGVYDRQSIWRNQGEGIDLNSPFIGTNPITGKKNFIHPGDKGDTLRGGWVDGYFGLQESMRHGGTNMSWANNPDDLESLQDDFRSRGLDYYLDPETQMYKLRPLEEANILNSKVTLSPQGPNPNLKDRAQGIDLVDVPGAPKKLKKLKKDTKVDGVSNGEGIESDPSNTSNSNTPLNQSMLYDGLGKYAEIFTALGANKAAADLYKKTPAMQGIAPQEVNLLQDGYATVGRQSNYISSQQRAVGRQMGNASANLQASLASMGDMENKAAETDMQGAMKMADIFNQSLASNLNTINKNTALRVANANQNKQYALAKEAADNSVDAQRIMADTTQVIIPAISEDRANRKQKNAALRQLDYHYGLQNLQNQYGMDLAQKKAAAEKAYEDYLTANPKATRQDITNWQATNEEYGAWQKASRQMDMDAMMLKYQYLFKDGGKFLASGGTLSAADRARLERIKAFNKSLLDFAKRSSDSIHKSQDRTAKGIMQLGSHIADLRTKSLGFK